MSTVLRTGVQRKRSRVPEVAAVAGLLLAAGWTFGMRHLERQSDLARKQAAQEHAHALLDLLRSATQTRVVADAQMLGQDPRLQSTLAVADVDDATILDILHDLRKLNPDSVFAVLSAAGKVRVTLGAPKLEGQDLAQSPLVQAALQEHEKASLGTWLVDDRVLEVAVIAVRAGERPVALLAVGARIDDSQLAVVARAAGVHLALLVNEQPVWSDAALPPPAWAAGDVERIEVPGTSSPARYVAAALPAAHPTERLVFAVPALALLFAVLAFWRGGAR